MANKRARLMCISYSLRQRNVVGVTGCQGSDGASITNFLTDFRSDRIVSAHPDTAKEAILEVIKAL